MKKALFFSNGAANGKQRESKYTHVQPLFFIYFQLEWQRVGVHENHTINLKFDYYSLLEFISYLIKNYGKLFHFFKYNYLYFYLILYFFS